MTLWATALSPNLCLAPAQQAKILPGLPGTGAEEIELRETQEVGSWQEDWGAHLSASPPQLLFPDLLPAPQGSHIFFFS